MVEVNVKVRIDSPLDKVWEIISNIDNDRTFWKGMASIRNISSEGDVITREITLGTSNKCTQIVTLYPKSKIITEWTKGIFSGTKNVMITPDGNGTQMEVSLDYSLSGMAKFMSGKITKDLQSEADEAVRLIKETAEGKSMDAPQMEERPSWADLINSK